MVQPTSYCFENLKKEVLQIAGFTNLIPANCKVISSLIEAKTKHKVSETTLKRVFGFALSKTHPSLFTLAALSQYCNYRGWDDFCENQENLQGKISGLDGNNLSNSANKITRFTLQALKNKSGIPYNQTIKRKFIDDHLDVFLNGDYDATIISAPAGYGKTIALCHWIEERLALEATDDILFFSMNSLMNVFFTGQDLNLWLLALLGYSSEQDIASLIELKQKNKSHFFLIIDGLDNYTYKSDQFHSVLEQILDIFSFYKNHSWFKIILTMRSATLASYAQLLDYDQPNWFKGFITNGDGVTNVPLFNISEIQRLSIILNANETHIVDADTVKKIGMPLYFEFYYKNQRDNFSLKKIDQNQFYELISTFILRKIYTGINSTEKVLLINALWLKMDFKNQTFAISKIDVYPQIKQYKQAYQELLSIGYIKEVNTSSASGYEKLLYFGNYEFLTYTIAKNLINDHDNIIDCQLISLIANIFHDRTIKTLVLKWCIKFAINANQTLNLDLLHKAGLNPNEKSDIIALLSSLFKKEFSTSKNAESIPLNFGLAKGNCLSNYFLGIELINPEYKKILSPLLNYGLLNKERILIHCSLAIIAIVELDINQLEEQLANLKKFNSEDYEEFPVNPSICLESVYYYLKYGIIKQEAFTLLTKFYFNPYYKKNVSDNTNDVLYLLAIYTLAIFNKPRKTHKLITVINKVYKKDHVFSYAYDFLFKTLSATTSLCINKLDDSLEQYNELSQLYNEHKKDYTPYMCANLNLLKLKISVIAHKKHDIFENVNTILNLTEQFGYKLLKLNCLVFILENQDLLKSDADFYKFIYFEFIKITRESSVRSESCINSELNLIKLNS